MEIKAGPHMFWVYILQCSDNSYYTGHTDNLDTRLYQHCNKNFPSCYTATRLPVKLVYSEQFPSRIEALQAEKQIQGWSRKKKEALISGDWEKLSYLARRKKK
jgi:putative endonuclease